MPIAYNARDAARELGLSVRTLKRLIASGAIKAKRGTKRTLVDAGSLQAYFDGLEDVEPGDPLFPHTSKPRRAQL